jgi:transcriptional regulator with XRE-family HTH domain
MEGKTGSFARKLEELFETHRKPDGTRYTQNDVIEGTGGNLTRVYLWKLRTGHSTNPGYHIVQAIANFFGVEPNYFFDTTEAKPQIVVKPEMSFTEEILLRREELDKLDKEGREIILCLIDLLIKQRKERRVRKK